MNLDDPDLEECYNTVRTLLDQIACINECLVDTVRLEIDTKISAKMWDQIGTPPSVKDVNKVTDILIKLHQERKLKTL